MENEKKVAIINTDKTLMETLEESMEISGYGASSISYHEVAKSKKNYEDFIRTYDPDFLIIDVPLPYEQNFKIIDDLRKLQISQNRKFILTSTNIKKMEELLQPDKHTRIIEKPYDLEHLFDALESFQTNS